MTGSAGGYQWSTRVGGRRQARTRCVTRWFRSISPNGATGHSHSSPGHSNGMSKSAENRAISRPRSSIRRSTSPIKPRNNENRRDTPDGRPPTPGRAAQAACPRRIRGPDRHSARSAVAITDWPTPPGRPPGRRETGPARRPRPAGLDPGQAFADVMDTEGDIAQPFGGAAGGRQEHQIDHPPRRKRRRYQPRAHPGQSGAEHQRPPPWRRWQAAKIAALLRAWWSAQAAPWRR